MEEVLVQLKYEENTFATATNYYFYTKKELLNNKFYDTGIYSEDDIVLHIPEITFDCDQLNGKAAYVFLSIFPSTYSQSKPFDVFIWENKELINVIYNVWLVDRELENVGHFTLDTTISQDKMIKGFNATLEGEYYAPKSFLRLRAFW